MKGKINYIIAAMSILIATSLCGCGDEDNAGSWAEAVLTSSTTLNFDATASKSQIITVVSDGSWYVESPDWVTVNPNTGIAGTTEVELSVADNMRDGAVDNPRKSEVVFRGTTKASCAHVAIRQDGDKFRDGQVYTIAEVENVADETTVTLKNLTVMAVTEKGIVATDGNKNLYITDATVRVTPGDKMTVAGSKFTDNVKLAYVVGERISEIVTGGEVPVMAPSDISEQLDTYKNTTRAYISVKGLLDGSTVKVEGLQNVLSISDQVAGLNISALNGHEVELAGYYAGTAAPLVKVIATNIKDLGVREVVFFNEDFEWLEPWATEGNCGSTVETDNPDATAPQIATLKVDGVSAADALEYMGYTLHRVCHESKKIGECIYLQKNYLKFGKTAYQAGISLPSIKDIPAGTNLILSFDWCPQRQGSGKIDPVNLIVVIENGDKETTFEVPTHGWENNHTLEWIKAEVNLSGVAVDENTVITIRQTEWAVSTANRWFLDNIKLRQAE